MSEPRPQITTTQWLSDKSEPGRPVYDYRVIGIKNVVQFAGEQIYIGLYLGSQTVTDMIVAGIDVIVKEPR